MDGSRALGTWQSGWHAQGTNLCTAEQSLSADAASHRPGVYSLTFLSSYFNWKIGRRWAGNAEMEPTS